MARAWRLRHDGHPDAAQTMREAIAAQVRAELVLLDAQGDAEARQILAARAA